MISLKLDTICACLNNTCCALSVVWVGAFCFLYEYCSSHVQWCMQKLINLNGFNLSLATTINSSMHKSRRLPRMPKLLWIPMVTPGLPYLPSNSRPLLVQTRSHMGGHTDHHCRLHRCRSYGDRCYVFPHTPSLLVKHASKILPVPFLLVHVHTNRGQQSRTSHTLIFRQIHQRQRHAKMSAHQPNMPMSLPESQSTKTREETRHSFQKCCIVVQYVCSIRNRFYLARNRILFLDDDETREKGWRYVSSVAR